MLLRAEYCRLRHFFQFPQRLGKSDPVRVKMREFPVVMLAAELRYQRVYGRFCSPAAAFVLKVQESSGGSIAGFSALLTGGKMRCCQR